MHAEKRTEADGMIAIHHAPRTFSPRWIEWCERSGQPYRIVNCFAPDVIDQLQGCTSLLWHWNHLEPAARIAARSIIAAAEAMGLAVFPNLRTCLHFDDKIAQKYLLEAIGAPLVPTWVFYDERSALEWIRGATFPKVFKLRGGAGSANVRLVRSRRAARALVARAFGAGFEPVASYLSDASTRFRKARPPLGAVVRKALRAPRDVLRLAAMRRALGAERGYAYFQEFVPGNDRDTRVTVIGDRAFAFQRRVRPGDFRASGSGMIDSDPSRIRGDVVEVAFEVSRALAAQSLAIDFLIGGGRPLIAEISYAFKGDPVAACPGHWDSRSRWRDGSIRPEDAILVDLLAGGGATRVPAPGDARRRLAPAPHARAGT
jgi:glutathione synthase/RimK-type ligase-like ATP-grasp enzyme